MMYFGVQLFNHAFHIAAVSKGFVPLEHLYLKFNRHRKIVDMKHFLRDWELFRFKSQCQKNGNKLEIPFLLALSFKIFHQDDIKTFASVDDLPF